MITSRVVALTSLYLLVVCAIGMLHPVRNALVLGALGGRDFYKVYLASALVAVAVIPFGRLATRVPQRRLTPAVAVFFALNLLLFRALFPGSVAFGVLFYAWHDLYAGILVSQFFLATAELLDPRSAKATYPLIVGAGSIGAALGGAVTGFLAPAFGVPNLLLVAAGLTLVFAVALPAATGASGSRAAPHVGEPVGAPAMPIRDVVANRQVQLIAATVVLTVLVKQLVDYQFNAATATVGDREAISAFQGKFSAATQWLPLVAAMAIRPALARWGVGAALLMMPTGMIIANVLLGTRGGLGPAAFAKGTDTALRHSAERTGREILYFPVPPDVRRRAKPLIDVGLESGFAKAAGAGVIFILLATLGPSALPWVSVGLAALWLGAAVAERRAYVRALADLLRAPAPGLAELAATLGDPEAQRVVRRALADGDTRRVTFVLDLLASAEPAYVDVLVAELRALTRHPDANVRARADALLSSAPETRPTPATPAAVPARPLHHRNGADVAAALLHDAVDPTLDLHTRTSALRMFRRLHDRESDVPVPNALLRRMVDEHLDSAGRYATAGAALQPALDSRPERLLSQATVEAWRTRQLAVFDGLALMHDERVVEGCYRAITGGNDRRRAEALELVGEAAGRDSARRLAPILRPEPDYTLHRAAAVRPAVAVTSLQQDDDAWVAHCAAYCDRSTEDVRMHPIERVFLLQRVDVFEHASTHHLARIAHLAREVDAPAGTMLLSRTEPADAMYVVIEGELVMEAADRSWPIRAGESAGALALLDDEPLGIDVRVVRASHLLRLTRRALHDLLRDDPEIAVSLLQGIARRLRTLAAARSASAVDAAETTSSGASA